MRPVFVVVSAPVGDDLFCMWWISEPVFIQTLVPELPVEAFVIRILRGLAGLDQAQFNTFLIRSLIKRFAGKFRALIRPDCQSVAAKLRNCIKSTGDMVTADTVAHNEIQRFLLVQIGLYLLVSRLLLRLLR